MIRPRPAAIAAILAAGLAAYAGSFRGAFVLDDLSSIADNPTIRHLWDWKAVLTPLRGGGLTVDGRPVLNLSFAINYALSGTGPWSYHLVNLAIHLAAALTLFGIVWRVLAGASTPGAGGAVAGRPVWAGFCAALLWVVHPLDTEAVTYVAQRAESLMALFYLLTLYCFIRGVVSAGPGAAAVTGIFHLTRGVIFDHLIRRAQMVKCTKGQVRQLKKALGWKGRPEQRQRIQMVLLRESGMTQPAIAEAMGVSLSTVMRRRNSRGASRREQRADMREIMLSRHHVPGDRPHGIAQRIGVHRPSGH